MIDLDSVEALPLLAERLGRQPNELRLTPLGGGVSNHVYLIEAEGLRCVAKQALDKLRVEQDWYCSRARIHSEAAAMRALGQVLPPGSVPGLLFEDFDNGIIVMESAPPEAQTWKSLLMQGACDERPARMTGLLHAAWIRESVLRPGWGEEFGDLQTFIDLRVDPYYRTTAARHPDLSKHFAFLIKQCLERRVSLVHGDLSPKNLLILAGSVTLIDHEVIHWGDPSFDAAFLTNHLILKGFYRPDLTGPLRRLASAYWDELRSGSGAASSWIESAAMAHLGGLMLARVDGKSPVEYLDHEVRECVRQQARELIQSPPASSDEAFERCFKI